MFESRICNLGLTGPSLGLEAAISKWCGKLLNGLTYLGGGGGIVALNFCGDWHVDINSLVSNQTQLYFHNLHSVNIYVLRSGLVWAVEVVMSEIKWD